MSNFQAPRGASMVLDHRFDGGAGSYFVVGIGAFLLTALTLGIATPWAICMTYRWRAQHTLINGQRVRFSGTGGGLFGHWIKWWFFSIITVGIYTLWVQPRLQRWIVEHYRVSVPVSLSPMAPPY